MPKPKRKKSRPKRSTAQNPSQSAQQPQADPWANLFWRAAFIPGGSAGSTAQPVAQQASANPFAAPAQQPVANPFMTSAAPPPATSLAPLPKSSVAGFNRNMFDPGTGQFVGRASRGGQENIRPSIGPLAGTQGAYQRNPLTGEHEFQRLTHPAHPTLGPFGPASPPAQAVPPIRMIGSEQATPREMTFERASRKAAGRPVADTIYEGLQQQPSGRSTMPPAPGDMGQAPTWMEVNQRIGERKRARREEWHAAQPSFAERRQARLDRANPFRARQRMMEEAMQSNPFLAATMMGGQEYAEAASEDASRRGQLALDQQRFAQEQTTAATQMQYARLEALNAKIAAGESLTMEERKAYQELVAGPAAQQEPQPFAQPGQAPTGEPAPIYPTEAEIEGYITQFGSGRDRDQKGLDAAIAHLPPAVQDYIRNRASKWTTWQKANPFTTPEQGAQFYLDEVESGRRSLDHRDPFSFQSYRDILEEVAQKNTPEGARARKLLGYYSAASPSEPDRHNS